jgi:hypothetical protein
LDMALFVCSIPFKNLIFQDIIRTHAQIEYNEYQDEIKIKISPDNQGIHKNK